MNENIAVNITLSREVVEYLDTEAKRSYLSRATVAKQFLLEHIDELRVISARRQGYSIRKISEIYGIPYSKVLEIMHATQVDAEDKELDSYIEQTLKNLSKEK